jgi:hypothetical protein
MLLGELAGELTGGNSFDFNGGGLGCGFGGHGIFPLIRINDEPDFTAFLAR